MKEGLFSISDENDIVKKNNVGPLRYKLWLYLCNIIFFFKLTFFTQVNFAKFEIIDFLYSSSRKFMDLCCARPVKQVDGVKHTVKQIQEFIILNMLDVILCQLT